MIYISLHHKKLRHKTDLEWALRGTVVNQNNKQSMLFNVKTRHIDCIIIYTWMFIQSYDTQYPRVHADKKSWTCDSKRKPFLALFCCMIYNSQMIRSVYYKFFVRKDMIAFVNVFEILAQENVLMSLFHNLYDLFYRACISLRRCESLNRKVIKI